MPFSVTDRKFAYVWTCRDDLRKASKFVLATDADGPGQVLSEELARRLGREKCWRVNWPVTPDGRQVKDANEALMALGGAGVRAAIEAATPFPAEGIVESEQTGSRSGAGQLGKGSEGLGEGSSRNGGLAAGLGSPGDAADPKGVKVGRSSLSDSESVSEPVHQGDGLSQSRENGPFQEGSPEASEGSQARGLPGMGTRSMREGMFTSPTTHSRATALRAGHGPGGIGTGFGGRLSGDGDRFLMSSMRALSTSSRGSLRAQFAAVRAEPRAVMEIWRQEGMRKDRPRLVRGGGGLRLLEGARPSSSRKYGAGEPSDGPHRRTTSSRGVRTG